MLPIGFLKCLLEKHIKKKNLVRIKHVCLSRRLKNCIKHKSKEIEN